MRRHEAALACGKLTRGDTGGQPTPSEVMMSSPFGNRSLPIAWVKDEAKLERNF
jgi:hypothetical protein